MSVQVKRRRETAAFLAGFVGAQAELIVDTTNNRVQVHDGLTPGGFPAAKVSEVVTNARVAVSDSNYTASASDRTIALTTLTAPRTITLPSAASFPTGTRLLVVDESGLCGATARITIAASGSDKINAAATAYLATAHGSISIQTNGVGGWVVIDQPTGGIAASTGAPVGNLLFTPGGDSVLSFYRLDAARAQNPRTSTITGVASTTITLAGANDATLFFSTVMAGVSYARLWNTTKSPAQSAWIKATPAANQLVVTSAGDIAAWTPGDVVQIGDPSSLHGGANVVALDISPLQQTMFGTVFPQTGIMARALVSGVDAAIAVSPTAASGSFVPVNCVNDGVAVNGLALIPCSVPSPISNSNLIFVRETIASPNLLGTTLLSSLALFG